MGVLTINMVMAVMWLCVAKIITNDLGFSFFLLFQMLC